MQSQPALIQGSLQFGDLVSDDLSIRPLDAIKQQNKGFFNMGFHGGVMNKLISLLLTLSAFAISHPKAPLHLCLAPTRDGVSYNYR